jgi:hypothetical protein
VDDQILVVEFLIWTDRFPLARDLRLAGRVPHRRWMPSQLPFTAPGNRAVIECSTKTESVPGKSLTIPSYVAVKERRIRITKGQQKVTQRVHTESSNFVFHIESVSHRLVADDYLWIHSDYFAKIHVADVQRQSSPAASAIGLSFAG